MQHLIEHITLLVLINLRHLHSSQTGIGCVPVDIKTIIGKSRYRAFAFVASMRQASDGLSFMFDY